MRTGEGMVLNGGGGNREIGKIVVIKLHEGVRFDGDGIA